MPCSEVEGDKFTYLLWLIVMDFIVNFEMLFGFVSAGFWYFKLCDFFLTSLCFALLYSKAFLYNGILGNPWGLSSISAAMHEKWKSNFICKKVQWNSKRLCVISFSKVTKCGSIIAGSIGVRVCVKSINELKKKIGNKTSCQLVLPK